MCQNLKEIFLQNVLKPEGDMPVERQPGVVEPKSHEREQKIHLKDGNCKENEIMM